LAAVFPWVAPEAAGGQQPACENRNLKLPVKAESQVDKGDEGQCDDERKSL